jgi:hypothetical protein
LLNQSTKPDNLSKTAGPAGFGLRSPPIYDDVANSSFAKSGNLLDKIRRNQQQIANTSLKNQRKESMFADTANDYGNITVANTPARRTLGNSNSFAVDPKSLFRSNTNNNAVNARLGSSCSERVNTN